MPKRVETLNTLKEAKLSTIEILNCSISNVFFYILIWSYYTSKWNKPKSKQSRDFFKRIAIICQKNRLCLQTFNKSEVNAGLECCNWL